MKIYIQVGKTAKGFKVNATRKNPKGILHNNQKVWREYYPTITFSIDVNLPENAFDLAEEAVAEINLTNEQIRTSQFEVEVGETEE